MADPDIADVLIAGGGPVGAMLALGLRECGASVLQVRVPLAPTLQVERPIALSHGSRLLLEGVGAWPATTPTAINEIHVSQKGGFGRTLIRAADCNLPALGYVAPYTAVLEWLAAADATGTSIEGKVIDWNPGVDHIEIRVGRSAGGETLERARLLVLADGGQASLLEKRHDYGQHAIVAEVQAERAHRNIAWERFTRGGPIALLPYENRHALVWSVDSGAAQALRELPADEFLLRLGAAFGGRLGAFLSAGPRASFALSLCHRRVAPSPRTLLVGNAAQTLHPVAGQGLNLGLRDAVELSELIAGTPGTELGSDTFLRRYSVRRRLDRGAGIHFTDALVRLFSNSSTALGLARGAGLALLDAAQPVRRFLARRMIYGVRGL